MSREEYHEELELIERRIGLLFGEVENAVGRALEALLTGDEALARETIAHDDLIDQLVVSTEEAVFTTIARQQPVAGDLRYLMSVVRMGYDLERCGDLALRVAKLTFDREWNSRAGAIKPFLRELGTSSVDMLHMAAKAWIERDPAAWEKLEVAGLDADTLYGDFLQELKALEGPHSGAIAIRAHAAGQAVERISDHAVCLAQRVRFIVTGDPDALVGEVAPS